MSRGGRTENGGGARMKREGRSRSRSPRKGDQKRFAAGFLIRGMVKEHARFTCLLLYQLFPLERRIYMELYRNHSMRP
ncbi:unnamed protein product [Cylicocyclus nassatus]|uniref:Uncharacterized protein n=1 Tax=Cylicocyclus nassatus TaxID=53992 RepID=A0AA36GL66_CYLNA|nr:unnamed protein product [Cylicocyclus nassatus]